MEWPACEWSNRVGHKWTENKRHFWRTQTVHHSITLSETTAECLTLYQGLNKRMSEFDLTSVHVVEQASTLLITVLYCNEAISPALVNN